MRVVSLFAIFFILSSCAGVNSEETVSVFEDDLMKDNVITTLILIRHAEKKKIDNDDNPPLNKLGEKRAQLLSSIFVNAKINAIYSTPFDRNINTVKPLADTLNISIRTYDQDLNLVTFLKKVKEGNKGKKVMICGHSTTIPEMLNILRGNKEHSEFSGNRYNDVFLVSCIEGGESIVTGLNIQL